MCPHEAEKYLKLVIMSLVFKNITQRGNNIKSTSS